MKTDSSVIKFEVVTRKNMPLPNVDFLAMELASVIQSHSPEVREIYTEIEGQRKYPSWEGEPREIIKFDTDASFARAFEALAKDFFGEEMLERIGHFYNDATVSARNLERAVATEIEAMGDAEES